MIKIEGTVRRWFESDLHTIRDSLVRAREYGIWSYPTPGKGRPAYYRMPPPLHPLEHIAAMRGGLGPLEWDTVNGEYLMLCGQLRYSGWAAQTERIARALYVNVSTLRFLWHVLTPLNVPEEPVEYSGVLHTLRNWWYADLGFCAPGPGPGVCGPARPLFWSSDIFEDITL